MKTRKPPALSWLFCFAKIRLSSGLWCHSSHSLPSSSGLSSYTGVCPCSGIGSTSVLQISSLRRTSISRVAMATSRLSRFRISLRAVINCLLRPREQTQQLRVSPSSSPTDLSTSSGSLPGTNLYRFSSAVKSRTMSSGGFIPTQIALETSP